jgi:hypothetical protein
MPDLRGNLPQSEGADAFLPPMLLAVHPPSAGPPRRTPCRLRALRRLARLRPLAFRRGLTARLRCGRAVRPRVTDVTGAGARCRLTQPPPPLGAFCGAIDTTGDYTALSGVSMFRWMIAKEMST